LHGFENKKRRFEIKIRREWWDRDTINFQKSTEIPFRHPHLHIFPKQGLPPTPLWAGKYCIIETKVLMIRLENFYIIDIKIFLIFF